jgi:hypothetical protein
MLLLSFSIDPIELFSEAEDFFSSICAVPGITGIVLSRSITLRRFLMSDAPSKLQRLEQAGILEQRQFTTEEIALVEKIDDDEIEVLIRLRQKLGEAGDGKNHIRPNFIV